MIRRWDVWYWRKEYARKALLGELKPTVESLQNTHTFLTHVRAESYDEVFHNMQGEIWSPNGEARGLIQALDLGHTSMSVGDITHDVVNNEWWICKSIGWEQLNQEEE